MRLSNIGMGYRQVESVKYIGTPLQWWKYAMLASVSGRASPIHTSGVQKLGFAIIDKIICRTKRELSSML